MCCCHVDLNLTNSFSLFSASALFQDHVETSRWSEKEIEIALQGELGSFNLNFCHLMLQKLLFVLKSLKHRKSGHLKLGFFNLIFFIQG